MQANSLRGFVLAVGEQQDVAANEARKLTRKERAKAKTRKLRAELLDAYGHKCACCGETTAEFLGIDHIFNDGAAHRKELGGGGFVYGWLKRHGYPKDRFQLLCHNCNFAKGRYGACPHSSRLAPL